MHLALSTVSISRKLHESVMGRAMNSIMGPWRVTSSGLIVGCSAGSRGVWFIFIKAS